MFKYFLILGLGVAIGYGYGFKDAQTNDKNIVERTVDGMGSGTRSRMANDVDGQLRSADSR